MVDYEFDGDWNDVIMHHRYACHSWLWSLQHVLEVCEVGRPSKYVGYAW